jgi:hypothetical protein
MRAAHWVEVENTFCLLGHMDTLMAVAYQMASLYLGVVG